MVWTTPGVELYSLKADRATQQSDDAPVVMHQFVATGTGFVEGRSQLLFVRVNQDQAGHLQAFQVIPCEELSIKEIPDGQEISFEASLYQRDGGAYHLIAWNPSVDGVNQACVLEWALGVTEVPGQAAVVPATQ